MHRNSNQGAWSELSEEVASNLSKSVVILALSDGDYMCCYTLLAFPNIYLSIASYNRFLLRSCVGHKVLFASSGIAVERLGHVTRVVTSASLVKALNDQRKEHDELKVGAASHPSLIFFLHKRSVIIVYFFFFVIVGSSAP